MGITGKYNFPGIQKMGSAGLRVALASSPYTAWTIKIPGLTDFILGLLVNWLANQGLVVLNIGANFVNGEIDQSALDSALDKAFSEIENKGGRDKLTAAEKKAIDDDVIKKARKFIVIGNGSQS